MVCSGQGSSEETHRANQSIRQQEDALVQEWVALSQRDLNKVTESSTASGHQIQSERARAIPSSLCHLAPNPDALTQSSSARAGIHSLLRILVFHPQTVKVTWIVIYVMLRFLRASVVCVETYGILLLKASICTQIWD